MWTRSENGENIIPTKYEESGDNVILRKNFKHIDATEEMPEHYEYDEWQMSRSQYEVYLNFEQKMNEQDDALIELAGLISEVV